MRASHRDVNAYREIQRAVREGGINAPAYGNLKDRLKLAETDMRLLTRLLREEELARRVGPNLVDAGVFGRCRAAVQKHFQDQHELSLREFRDATGAARNLAVALLEAFDAENLTRRAGDGRVPGPALT